MKVLFLDTTTKLIILGIYDISIHSIGNTTTADSIVSIDSYSGFHPKESSNLVFPKLLELKHDFQTSPPDRILVCTGPGSFAGIRIGVGIGRSLSQVWNIPVLGIPTIELYVSHFEKLGIANPLILIEGGMKKYFVGSANSHVQDLTFPEIETNFFQDQKYSLVTDFSFEKEHIYLPDSIPSPVAWIAKNLPRIQNLNLEENSFHTLLPFYLRGTYADGKEKKT